MPPAGCRRAAACRATPLKCTAIPPCPLWLQRVPRGALTLVSRYGEGEYDELADVPVLFHGTGHYDLLVVAAAQPHQLRSRL